MFDHTAVGATQLCDKQQVNGNVPVTVERLQCSKSGGTADSRMTVRPERKVWGGLFLREGTRQVEILVFPFAAAREPEKFAKRISFGCAKA